MHTNSLYSVLKKQIVRLVHLLVGIKNWEDIICSIQFMYQYEYTFDRPVYKIFCSCRQFMANSIFRSYCRVSERQLDFFFIDVGTGYCLVTVKVPYRV